LTQATAVAVVFLGTRGETVSQYCQELLHKYLHKGKQKNFLVSKVKINTYIILRVVINCEIYVQ